LAEKKVKARFPDGECDAFEVPVLESTERWTEVSLEDGTVLRVKTVILAVVRAEDAYDNEGNPQYSIKVNPVMTVTAPDNLKKGAKGPSTEIH
jgi:hypothetical protein